MTKRRMLGQQIELESAPTQHPGKQHSSLISHKGHGLTALLFTQLPQCAGKLRRKSKGVAMFLHKTEKARAELMPGQRSRPQRERTLMLLADGSKSAKDFSYLFGGDGELIVVKLLRDGFLETRKRASSPQSAKPTPMLIAAHPATAAAPSGRLPEKSATTSGSTDQFDGKRSLATTRMFLFDICERMFARRNPVLAEQFREALRQAKDRETMLSAFRTMLEEIERIAGPERADSISERIAMLLPPEVAMP